MPKARYLGLPPPAARAVPERDASTMVARS